MATKRAKPVDDGPTPPRRGGEPGGMRQLPENMHRLAAGDDYAMRSRKPRAEHVRDPRDRVLIPGVNNKDSRRVYDDRVTALRAGLDTDSDEKLGAGLLAVHQLRLYRARNVVDFQAFATSVLGMDLDRAEALLAAARSAAGASDEPLAEPLAALWIRTESALREHLGDAQVTLVHEDGGPRLDFSVRADPALKAIDALAAVGRQAAGLIHLLGKVGGAGPVRERDAAPSEAGDAESEEENPKENGDPRATVADRPLMRRPQGDDDHGPRGGFDRGPRRDDDRGPRGGFNKGPRRDDDRGPRGGFGQGFNKGPRRDDDRGPRGGFNKGPRRDDDRGPRGGFGQGFNKGPRRDDNRGPRGGFGQGFDRGPRGGFDKKNDRDED